MVALEGDGSLLMQLGCLATVAMQAPKNLTMVVWDNGLYQITGGQPTASASAADLVAIARGSGLANSAWAADEDDFDRAVRRRAQDGGPSLIAVRIDNKPGVGTTDRDPVQIRARFMQGLGVETHAIAGDCGRAQLPLGSDPQGQPITKEWRHPWSHDDAARVGEAAWRRSV